MPVRMTASITGGERKEKEKIRVVMFSPNGMQRASRMQRNIAWRFKLSET
jgi:hypothetical protein